jgi:transposase
MAYRYGERTQRMMFPESIEDYVPADAPVRAYDAFVEALDLEQLGLAWEPSKAGCPQYDPRAMLKLLLYGYSYGWRSSRKFERECHYNLSFIWLLGGLKPDHKTIAEFRRKNPIALKRVLGQGARLCLELGLIEGNTLFVDGSPLRGNASLKKSWTPKRCQKVLGKVEQRIEEILAECEQIDQKETGSPSLVHLQEELKDRQFLQDKVQGILAKLQTEERASLNTTDEDCVRLHSPQGSYAGYNAQSVVDQKHGLIVHVEAVSTNEDSGQFAAQIDQAQETLEIPCKTACSDAGYCNYDELKKVSVQGVDVIVPTRQQAQKGPAGAFAKSAFHYQDQNDVYVCPAGQELRYRQTDQDNRRIYAAGGKTCRDCEHFGVCTTAKKNGRRICRYEDESYREQLAHRYLEPDAQATYKLRRQKVELPFGHWKRNLEVTTLWLRGRAGANAELSLLGICFNMVRMINLLGVTGVIKKLAHS